MTTIVYNHNSKQIACDSRESASGFIVSDNAKKCITNNGDVWFICGSKSDAKIFTEEFKHNALASDNITCGGFLVRDGIAYKACNEDGVYKLDRLVSTDGLGSGGWMALSAVDLGKTSKEAVEYAITRDCYSGGKIHVYDIEKKEFI